MIKNGINIWTRPPVVYDPSAKDFFARVAAAGSNFNNQLKL